MVDQVVDVVSDSFGLVYCNCQGSFPYLALCRYVTVRYLLGDPILVMALFVVVAPVMVAPVVAAAVPVVVVSPSSTTSLVHHIVDGDVVVALS